MIRHIYLILVVFLIGCTNNISPDDIMYYPSGEIREERFFIDDGTILMKEYYKNGGIMSVSKMLNGEFEGPIIHYYENGNVKNLGQFQGGNSIGWHSFYSEHGVLEAKRRYIIVDTSSFLNEVIYLNGKGDTLKERSNYFTLHVQNDTIKLGEDYLINIKLDAPYFKDKMLVFIGDFDSLFNSPDSLPVDVCIGENFIAQYKLKPKIRGKQTLRGVISDHTISKEDTSKIDERLLYFSKGFYVK